MGYRRTDCPAVMLWERAQQVHERVGVGAGKRVRVEESKKVRREERRRARASPRFRRLESSTLTLFPSYPLPINSRYRATEVVTWGRWPIRLSRMPLT